jgi:hypothetical protein
MDAADAADVGGNNDGAAPGVGATLGMAADGRVTLPGGYGWLGGLCVMGTSAPPVDAGEEGPADPEFGVAATGCGVLGGAAVGATGEAAAIEPELA